MVVEDHSASAGHMVLILNCSQFWRLCATPLMTARTSWCYHGLPLCPMVAVISRQLFPILCSVFVVNMTAVNVLSAFSNATCQDSPIAKTLEPS